MNTNNLMLNAALARFVAQREEARAVLVTYLTNSVGAGSHGNLLDDVVEWTKKLAEAEECISTLRKTFVGTEPEGPVISEVEED